VTLCSLPAFDCVADTPGSRHTISPLTRLRLQVTRVLNAYRLAVFLKQLQLLHGPGPFPFLNISCSLHLR